MKCRTPQACPFWSLPNNVKRQLYWTVLLNACSLFKYCLTKYDACSGEAFEVARRILIRNVQRALVLLPLLPSVPGQCWVPTFDVWGISALEPLVGSQLKPALLSQRPEFFEQRELEDLQSATGGDHL